MEICEYTGYRRVNVFEATPHWLWASILVLNAFSGYFWVSQLVYVVVPEEML